MFKMKEKKTIKNKQIKQKIMCFSFKPHSMNMIYFIFIPVDHFWCTFGCNSY